MKKKLLIIIPSLCMTFLASCNKEQTYPVADMVVFGDQIYTANSNEEFVEAFAVKEGKYIYVGDANTANKYIGKNTSVYNYAFVMPSAIETHAHFLLENSFFQTCYLNSKNEKGELVNKETLLNCIEKYATDNEILDSENPHLFGYGYDQLSIPTNLELLYREDLDGLCNGKVADVPVYIAETSLHQAWVNTLTLERAGIKITLPKGESDPVSGILRDDDGVALGVLINEAISYVLQKGFQFPILDDDGYQKAVKDTCYYLNKMGYTGHYDAWTNFDGSDRLYKALYDVDKNNELTCFFTTCYNITTYEYNSEKLDDILNKVDGYRNKYTNTHTEPKFIKLFADGVLESGTGFLKEPYLFDDQYYGQQIWKQNEMDQIVLESNKRDLLVHTHVLGDASCEEAVNAYVKSNVNLNKKTRNSLAHCVLVDEPERQLIKSEEIGVAVNAGWLTDTSDTFCDPLVGKERQEQFYPYDGLTKLGVKTSVCTDRPCSDGPIDVFDYMGCMLLGYNNENGNHVARRKIDLSVKDAINMMTINGAWTANYEEERGSIEVGKFADFIVSDFSPFNCAFNIIKDIEVKATVFEGKFVYLKND